MASNGGAYTILIGSSNAKNNKQDKILLANELLSNRITKLNQNKKYRIDSDIKDILIHIEKCKNQLTKKIDNNKKKLVKDKLDELNQELIKKRKEVIKPTINDITTTHHLFLESSFKPFVSIGYEYSKVPVSPIPNFGNSVKIKIPKFGDFFNDMTVYVKLEGLKPINPVNRVKYCQFLGHRLFKKIKFITNNIVIDEYTSEDYNFHYQFHVPDHKKNAWKKCVGQEVPTLAYLTPDPTYQPYKQQLNILDGPQTLKPEHTSVEMFIPLLFWYKDPKLAVPNMTLPFGQTFIEFELAAKDDICACSNFAADAGLFETPTMVDFHLYTNHIYINPDILDIFVKKISITLIRVHRQQEMILNQSFNEILLNELKYPIETMYATFRPTANIEGDDRMDTWHLNSQLDRQLLPTPVMYDTTGNGDYTFGTNYIVYYKENNIVNTIGLKADGVSIFQEIPSLFYNAYLPYQYGKSTTSPLDKNTYMFSFNFDPDSYQPNGYLNLSKIRRLYLYYNSTFIDSTNTCKLFVSAKAINFLLLKNGQLTLQYNV